jgi:amidase
MTDDLAFTDATDQAGLVRSGQASAQQLLDAAIARIEAVNPQLNAVIHRLDDAAREAIDAGLPDGPLTGVPVLVKDLDGYVGGAPYHAGNQLLKEVGYVAPADSHLISKLRQAGAVIVGKTNTPELGLLPTTEPVAYGPARNPWNPAHSTGGSSGGSAAAVASGMVPLAHAGDGGGSIRIPSSECGLVGLFPSRGRHSLGPEVGESWGGLVRRMMLARTVRDAALSLQVIQGPMPGDPYTAPPPACPYPEEVGADAGTLRIGLCTGAPNPDVATDPQCVAAAEGAAAALEALGHEVGPASPSTWGDAAFFDEFTGHFLTAFGVWAAHDLDVIARLAGREVTADDVEPGTWAVAEGGRQVTGQQYFDAVEFMHATTRRMATFWTPAADGGDGYDLLLTPTLPELPPPLGQFGSTPESPLDGVFRSAGLVTFVAPFNVSGQPAISLPLHTSTEGLPVGVQLVAAYGREDLLVRVAAQLEAAHPWADRRPTIHA